ncbi:hypothetical protein EYF80_001529 [Liparis tanakae]|uniref:Uncharacterized protein n=1 Tax=Liparis tanakae TaxID=230148 RepID=A0A4Z2JEV7_9TELE|nr:hypothetical protein EYF80_001529 [Liparis tanakae]
MTGGGVDEGEAVELFHVNTQRAGRTAEQGGPLHDHVLDGTKPVLLVAFRTLHQDLESSRSQRRSFFFMSSSWSCWAM